MRLAAITPPKKAVLLRNVRLFNVNFSPSISMCFFMVSCVSLSVCVCLLIYATSLLSSLTIGSSFSPIRKSRMPNEVMQRETSHSMVVGR